MFYGLLGSAQAVTGNSQLGGLVRLGILPGETKELKSEVSIIEQEEHTGKLFGCACCEHGERAGRARRRLVHLARRWHLLALGYQ